MDRITQILVAALLLPALLFSQETMTEWLPVQVDVVYLASDDLQGRETGTEGERLAAEYIARRFAQIGLKPYAAGNAATWYQPFDFVYKSNPHAEKGEDRTGKNVIGYIDNGADRTVVVGAHYDHLGMGGFGSRHLGEPAIHNGADDNASGVAGMLRIAEKLKASPARHNNYLFIAFSGEELGLYGSKYFAQHPVFSLENVNYMLNLDMVGRLNEEGVLAVNGAGTSPAWKTALEAVAPDAIQVKTNDSGIGPSDHTSFYLEDIPVLHFFTGQHEDYHKPEDDSPLVNYEGIVLVTDLIVDLIEKLDPEGELAFTKTKDEQEGRQAASFKVTLGVMPDYVYSDEGMRIDGVMEDRPAQKAGMKKGDVIVRMGEVEVKDIYDYMEGLALYKKGDKAKVVVKRGKEELTFEVEF